MTNITLAEYILRFNADNITHVQASKPITNSLIFKKVLRLLTPTANNPETYSWLYYFLEQEFRKSVSFVHGIEDDMHPFICPNLWQKEFIKNVKLDAILLDIFMNNYSMKISLLINYESDYV